MFVIPEIEGDHYGEPPSTMWNDLNGISSILSTIQAHPSREMDNYILSLDSTIIRTGLVVGPLIYGHGEGPGNQRSIQAPTIARKTIQDGEGFRFRRGLNTWSNVHIRDLGDLFALLTKTALDGPRNTRTSALWNETGVYLPANGDMVSLSVLSHGLVGLKHEHRWLIRRWVSRHSASCARRWRGQRMCKD